MKKKFPTFKTDEEAEHFVATADLSEYDFSGFTMRIRPLSKEEGGGFLAEFTDIPGCMSDGETFVEAFVNGLEARRDVLAVLKERGRKIPKHS